MSKKIRNNTRKHRARVRDRVAKSEAELAWEDERKFHDDMKWPGGGQTVIDPAIRDALMKVVAS